MDQEERYARLRAALLQATRAAFEEMRHNHPHEQFYAFALYTSGEAAYVAPSANTEEGLARLTQRDIANAEKEQVAHLYRASLRWSPCDWPYHLEGARHFTTVSRLLDEILMISREAEDDQSADTVFDLCLAVLQQLDGEGVFGTGAQRDALVLALLMGDQSDEDRIAWARRLNPPPVADRLAGELQAGYDAFKTLYPWPRDLPSATSPDAPAW